MQLAANSFTGELIKLRMKIERVERELGSVTDPAVDFAHRYLCARERDLGDRASVERPEDVRQEAWAIGIMADQLHASRMESAAHPLGSTFTLQVAA